jgi:integrase/recombinase XerD
MSRALHLVKPTATAARDLAARDPVALYLGTLSETGRRSMASKIKTLERLLDLKTIKPGDLGFVALAGRAALQDAGAAPATINATLSALKGIARAAWQLSQITAEHYEKIRDVRSVRGSRLPSGRAHSTDEIEKLLEACTNDRTAAGARDAAIIARQGTPRLRRRPGSKKRARRMAPAPHLQAWTASLPGHARRKSYLSPAHYPGDL